MMVTPIADVLSHKENCRRTMVYIADITGYALIVYDNYNQKSWRIQNKFFEPEPDYENITIAGDNFCLEYGILGLSVSPKKDLSRLTLSGGYLYFHSLAGIQEHRAPLRLLNNEKFWELHPNSIDYFETLGHRNTQSGTQAMDTRGNIYFGLMEDISIARWNIKTRYREQNFKIIDQNATTLQFVSDIKVKSAKESANEVLWAVSNRYEKYATGNLNLSEINFRIFKYILP